jgi:hypothetical protein
VKSWKCCISSVEIVSPTFEEMKAYNTDDVGRFYSTFTNTMGKIGLQHGCEMVQSVGDCLKFSFPLKSNLTDVGAVTNVLECFFEELEIRSVDMDGQKFQEISCRICADYGTCSQWEPGDEIECIPTISSMDSMRWRVPAQANTVIVGDEFNKVIETFPILREQYLLETKVEILIDMVPYPVYQLSRGRELSLSS